MRVGTIPLKYIYEKINVGTNLLLFIQNTLNMTCGLALKNCVLFCNKLKIRNTKQLKENFHLLCIWKSPTYSWIRLSELFNKYYVFFNCVN